MDAENSKMVMKYYLDLLNKTKALYGRSLYQIVVTAKNIRLGEQRLFYVEPPEEVTLDIEELRNLQEPIKSVVRQIRQMELNHERLYDRTLEVVRDLQQDFDEQHFRIMWFRRKEEPQLPDTELVWDRVPQSEADPGPHEEDDPDEF